MVAMANHNNNHSNPATLVHYQQQPLYVAVEAPQRWHNRVVQKMERCIFLYNVTTGLYNLDWWERYIYNTLFLVLITAAGYNSSHYFQRIGDMLLAWVWYGNSD